MSENTTWRDIVQAAHRLESNLDSYERGYKTGWKDALEHVTTLRDPDRLAEIQHLQEALRRKNEKYRRLRAQYKQLKDRKQSRWHVYVYRENYWNNTHEWVVDIFYGARLDTSYSFPTYAEALVWASSGRNND